MPDNTQYRMPGILEGESDAETYKRPCLIMIKGDFIGQIYELAREVTILGRNEGTDLVVPDFSVSRRHAMIVKKGDAFHISDLGSTNGTFVNREPLLSSRALVEGDKLTLGSVTFRFSFQDADDTEYHQLLRNMAIKDGLTRVYNKRYFMEALQKEFDYNRRVHAGLALVLFDIDHFKRVNDTWGHPVGDLILKQIAQLVEQDARDYDVFARYGGEEFVLLIRGSSMQSGVALAERIRQAVADHRFGSEGEDVRLTVSLGVAYWDGNACVKQMADLVELADHQLYESKHCGRNCVRAIIAGSPPESFSLA